MNDLVKLAPLAVGLIVFAGVIAFMLSRGMALGTWLLAAFLLGHGLVHMMFATPPAQPGTPGAEFAFDANRSWPVTARPVDVGTMRALVVGLVVLTILGYLLAALSTLGLVLPTALWPVLVIGATVASGGLMVIALMPGLALGIAIDIALVAIVVTRAWSPAPLTG